MRKKYKALTAPKKFDWGNPWQFSVGQSAYVWGFDQEFSFTVTAQLTLGPANFPHYVVTALNGDTWTVPQLHLSRQPITPRKA